MCLFDSGYYDEWRIHFIQMRFLKISPGHKPESMTVLTGLKSLRENVDGLIEAYHPYADSAGFICNKEGKFLGLGQEYFCSLTEEQIEKYSKMFEQSELFQWNGRQLIIIPAGI